VKKQDTIVGLLKRRECQDQSKGLVERYMQPLGEKILVSADMPLLEFIQNDSLDRLIINGTTIYGLVTRSDLLKLPVFLLGFALVTRIETLMLDMIRSTNVSNEEWLAWLHPKRKSEIQKEFDRLNSQRSDPDMLELTYFSDKCIILKQLEVAEKNAPHLLAKSFIEQLKEIKKLRNTVAHTGHSSDDTTNLEEFIERLHTAHQWIERIEQWQNDLSQESPHNRLQEITVKMS